MIKRYAFFVSDNTGVTAETLGKSLLAHFDTIEFETRVLSYIDNMDKAKNAVAEINRAAVESGHRPLVFDTIIDKDTRAELGRCKGFLVDVFSTYLAPLERELQTVSNFTVGRGHSVVQDAGYKSRINAVHYAIDNDDGQHASSYDNAELILVGVSRTGKTPTSIYMALQYGMYVANYPLTEEDLNERYLPASLKDHKDKLFGLNIDSERLAQIRQERRPNSRYASMTQCEDEIRLAKALYNRYRIPYLNTTHLSIEEIGAKIISMTGITRKQF